MFLHSVFEIMERNNNISLTVHKDDGIYLYHTLNPIAYIHVSDSLMTSGHQHGPGIGQNLGERNRNPVRGWHQLFTPDPRGRQVCPRIPHGQHREPANAEGARESGRHRGTAKGAFRLRVIPIYN